EVPTVAVRGVCRRVLLLVGRRDSDLTPLVDQEYGDRRVRRVDVAVQEFEREVRYPGVREELLRLVLRGLRILTEALQLLQVGIAHREGALRAHQPTDVLHDGLLRESVAARPPVDGQVRRVACPDVM